MNFHNESKAERYTPARISLQGYIQATYMELANVFGFPAVEDGEEHVYNYWRLVFQDGTVCTIYDWNFNGAAGNAVYSWHIGGADRNAAMLIHETFRERTEIMRRVA